MASSWIAGAKDLKGRAQGTVAAVVGETARLLPNGIIAASGLYALFTASRPFAVFFAAMLEAGLIYKLLNWGGSYLGLSRAMTPEAFSGKCSSSFSNRADFTGLAGLYDTAGAGSFPSYPYFMLTVASTYLFSTLNKLSKELETLGPAFASRYYTSMVFLGLLSLSFFAFRLMSGCEGFFTLALTFVVGYIIGSLLVEQNQRLFGSDSINLVGIPLLRNRTATGQPIYICPGAVSGS